MMNMDDDENIHYGFTKNKLVAAITASLGATFLATMFGEWYGSVGWPVSFSFNTLNAAVWANNFNTIGHNFYGFGALSPDMTYFLGMWAHYSQGLFFGLLFCFFIYRNFPGGMSVGNNLVKGTLWGITLVIVSNSFVMPLLYGSGFWFSHWGTFFPNAVGGGQANLAFDNIVWHATYGFLLGMFFSPMLRGGASMAASSGSAAMQWGQIVLGWIVIIIGGYVSSMGGSWTSTGAYVPGAYASWGVIPGIIGLIIATGPPFKNWRMK